MTIDLFKTGNNIREISERNGYTVLQLSRYLDITPMSIYKWYRGDCIPSVQHLVNMAELFSCRMEDMIVFQ